MGIVIFEGKIVEGESVDGFDVWIEAHGGEGAGFAAELEFGLIEVIRIEVEVSEGVDEVTGFEIANLGNHQC